MTILDLLLAAALATRPELSSAPPLVNMIYSHGEYLSRCGRHHEALAMFEQAYRLKPLPRLLIRIGDAHAALGEREAALGYYRRFQEQEPFPDAQIHAAVDQRISRWQTLRPTPASSLAASLEPQGAGASSLPLIGRPGAAGALPTPDRRPLYQRWLLWVPLGLTASGVIGVTLGLVLTRGNSASGAADLSLVGSPNWTTM